MINRYAEFPDTGMSMVVDKELDALEAENASLKDSVFQYGIENTKLQIARDEFEEEAQLYRKFIDYIVDDYGYQDHPNTILENAKQALEKADG